MEELRGDIDDCKEDGLITENEHKEMSELCRSAMYMSTRYIKSMSRAENRMNWKTPAKGKKFNVK